MNIRKIVSVILIGMLWFGILENQVEAGRVLSLDINVYINNLEMVYEKAKITMSCWLQRLASGPSPRGRGH